MAGWPVILNLTGRRIVVVGGGGVALRRVRTLLDSGAAPENITVIAPTIGDELKSLGIHFRGRPYRTGDCRGAFMVVVATDEVGLNESVAREAASGQALVNRADAPDEGDLSVMAHRRRGPVTVAVATDGASAAAARHIVESLVAAVDDDWITLLRTAGEFRVIARQRIADTTLRQTILRRLTDDAAMSALKQHGVAGLRQHLQQVMDNTNA
ncbi:MAG: bifunctional precorrin-2 dehydrogenase/sirohydrochlorin ferrochelatase [Phycisphaeraceae bacterium]